MDTEKRNKIAILAIVFVFFLIGISFDIGIPETPNNKGEVKAQQLVMLMLKSPATKPVVPKVKSEKKEKTKVGDLFTKSEPTQTETREEGGARKEAVIEEKLTPQQKKLIALGFDPRAKHSIN